MQAWESEPPCSEVIVCGHGGVNLFVQRMFLNLLIVVALGIR